MINIVRLLLVPYAVGAARGSSRGAAGLGVIAKALAVAVASGSVVLRGGLRVVPAGR